MDGYILNTQEWKAGREKGSGTVNGSQRKKIPNEVREGVLNCANNSTASEVQKNSKEN
jgi:hypothetical protein